MMVGQPGIPMRPGGPEGPAPGRDAAAERPRGSGSPDPAPVPFAAFLAGLSSEAPRSASSHRAAATGSATPESAPLDRAHRGSAAPASAAPESMVPESPGPGADATAAAEPASAELVDEVAPELRRRLDRVIRRMEALGHSVRVVEGYRSQARQDRLWSQGRERPGRQVTWTRRSLHTQGRAVDVQVDGSWTDLEGYRTLQRIAREEGLATLGMRDPGHLELPDDVPSARPGEAWPPPAWGRPEPVGRPRMAERPPPAGRPEPAWAPGDRGEAPTATPAPAVPSTPPPGVAVPAPVAPVAPVAGVAEPGRVAPVARPAPVAGAGGVVRAPEAGEPRTGERRLAEGGPSRPTVGEVVARSALRTAPGERGALLAGGGETGTGPDPRLAPDARITRNDPRPGAPSVDLRPAAVPEARLTATRDGAGDPTGRQEALPTAEARRLAGRGVDADTVERTVRGKVRSGEPAAEEAPRSRLLGGFDRIGGRGGGGEAEGGRLAAARPAPREPDGRPTDTARSPGSRGEDGSGRTSTAGADGSAGRAEAGSRAGPRPPEVGATLAAASGSVEGGERALPTGPTVAEPSTATERAARIQELQARARAAGGRIHLELSNLDGDGTNLRMRLHGARVATTVEFRDPDLTTHARTRVDELHRSLERAGLEPDPVVLRSGDAPAAEDRGQRSRSGGSWDGPGRNDDEGAGRQGRDDVPHQPDPERFEYPSMEEER